MSSSFFIIQQVHPIRIQVDYEIKINESYMISNADTGEYRFKQFITPMVRAILLAIFTVCDPQFKNSNIVIPR